MSVLKGIQQLNIKTIVMFNKNSKKRKNTHGFSTTKNDESRKKKISGFN